MIIEVIKRRQDKTFLLQSKDPSTFKRIKDYPENLLLGTTIETDRIDVYHGISKAPLPKDRIKSLKNIRHDRKMLTLEPVLKFNHEIMLDWIEQINPELLWLGFDTKKTPGLIEPKLQEAKELHEALVSRGYNIKLKYIP
jgi:hypothetical protein